MLRPTVCALAAFYSSLLTPHSSLAADKPVSVKDAAAKMTVPPGFRVTLFAGEPDVVQPIAFTFDDRGRMWVVECVTYPKWLPPGQKGKDRVVILEDTDGDGKHDKKTVVLDDGVNLSGIELGFGGVYLCSTPNLIYVPIKDDKPTGPPQILLDGWNLKDAKHNVFNSLNWGPDGWLYGCNGIQTKSWVGAPGTPQDARTYIDAGVWKYHPTRRRFEVVATGTTNPWGLDWDDRGEMFITNCVIDHLWHVVPGGRYQRMYGQDPNPFAFGLMSSCVDYRHWAGGHWTDSRADKATGALQKGHDDAGGGHAHSGCAIYLGDNFPAEYRNTLFTCNIHGSRLNNDGLERTPGGMKGVRRPDFLFANDPWFRGICVKQGPDGGLYVSDWCDTGECHNYDFADVSNGRIYRVIYGDRKGWTGDVSKMTDEELWKLHSSKNEWLVRKARRVLQERAAGGKPGKAPDEVAENPKLEPRVVWRVMATAHATGQLDSTHYAAMIADPDVTVATWGVRLKTDALPNPNPKLARLEVLEWPPELAKLARRATDGILRAAVAAACAKLPEKSDHWVAFRGLIAASDERTSADLALMNWYAIQPAILANPASSLLLASESNSRRLRTYSIRHALSLPDTRKPTILAQTLSMVANEESDEAKIDYMAGILGAFEDRKQVTPPDSWNDFFPPLNASKSERVRELANDLALKFGDDRAVVALIFQATHHKGTDHRSRAIEKLAPLKKPEYKIGEMLRKQLTDPETRAAAVRGLSHHPDAETPGALLAAYPQFTAGEKADAVLTLSSRKEFAAKLLDAVEAGSIPKSDLSAFAARQIVALNDAGIKAKLGKVWGEVKPANQNRSAQTARLKKLLSADYVKAADLAAGKIVYQRQCAACHKLFGDGGDVGPELTGSQRTNLDYVLENVLDPNAVVPFDYKMTAFTLADGRTVTGLVKKESPQAVTVRTVNELLVISVGDIEGRKPTNNSVMPEGLLDVLKDEEIRNLIGYLGKK